MLASTRTCLCAQAFHLHAHTYATAMYVEHWRGGIAEGVLVQELVRSDPWCGYGACQKMIDVSRSSNEGDKLQPIMSGRVLAAGEVAVQLLRPDCEIASRSEGWV